MEVVWRRAFPVINIIKSDGRSSLIKFLTTVILPGEVILYSFHMLHFIVSPPPILPEHPDEYEAT
jgi:hypothetical protein